MSARLLLSDVWGDFVYVGDWKWKLETTTNGRSGAGQLVGGGGLQNTHEMRQSSLLVMAT